MRQHRNTKTRRKPMQVLPLESLESRRMLDAVPIGNEFRVNTTTLDDQFAPAIAMDNAGNFVVVWTGDTPGAGNAPATEVWGQRYNSSGVAQGGEFQINQFTTGIQANPSVAMDADGDFVVAWESGPADTATQTAQDGSGFGIFARRYNTSGVAQGNEFQVNQFTTGDQLLPSIAVDANNNFVVAWQSAAQDGSGFGVYARRYNNAGAPLANEFRANTFTTDNQLEAAVAVDQDGDFVVTWTSGNLAAGQDGSFYGVYAQRYNASGVAQGAEFRVNQFTTDYQSSPSVAMDNAGNFVVAWNSFTQDGSQYGVYARRYNAAGTALVSEFLVNTFTAGSQSQPQIDLDGTGNFTIVWSSENQDGSGRGVYGKFYNSSGVVQGTEFRVNNFTPQNQTRPAVAMNAAGFVVAFQDGSQSVGVNGQDGSAYGVYARRYSTASDTTPPRVTSSTFNFLTGHSITLTFSEGVEPSFTTADTQLQNLTTTQFIPTGQMALSYAGGTNPATITFPGVTSNFGISTILPDGNYRLTLISAGITDSAGNPLDGDGNGTGGDNFTFNFRVLAGDATNNGVVNLDDFNILAGAFNTTGKNFSQGNFNYDAGGNVNLDDFNILAANFNVALAEPSVSSTAARGGVGAFGVRKSGFTSFSTRRITGTESDLPASL